MKICSKQIIKLTQILLIGILSNNSWAMGGRDSGYYLGMLAGPTKSSSTGSDSNSNSYGGNLYVGYEANPYFSYEGGLSIYPQATSSDASGSGCTSSNQKLIYLDVLLKGAVPLTSGGGIFTKAGVATPIYLPFLNGCKESSTMSNFYPQVVLGGYFDLTDGLVADLSWTRLVMGGSDGNVDLYAIGISYHFG